MLIVMHHWATDKDVALVKKTITSMGLKPVAIPGAERTAIGIIGNQGRVNDAPLRDIKAILEIIHVTKPYKLVSRDFHPADTVVTLGGKVKVGGKSPFLVIAGPCAVESRDQLMKTAQAAQEDRACRCCGAARTSRGPVRTASRGCAKAGWNFWTR